MMFLYKIIFNKIINKIMICSALLSLVNFLAPLKKLKNITLFILNLHRTAYEEHEIRKRICKEAILLSGSSDLFNSPITKFTAILKSKVLGNNNNEA